MISSQKQTKKSLLAPQFLCLLAVLLCPDHDNGKHHALLRRYGIVSGSTTRTDKPACTFGLSGARTELNVSNTGKGDLVTEYQYMISVDNTGDPTQARQDGCSPDNPGYPDSCNWPSIRAVPGAAPIYTQCNQDDFANGNTLNLPNGKYLISVIADGFKIER